MLNLKEFVKSSKLLIGAHRGASGEAPENTMPSYRLALESGVMLIELDIQFTKDNQAIVFHDDYLGRTTNCSGKVKNFNLQELKEMDAGSWFSQEFAGEKILSLKETLEFLKDKAYINIEIKPIASKESQKESIKKIIEIVSELELEPSVLFGSFDYAALELIKRIDPNLHTAAIKLPKDKRLPSEIKREINCDAYVCSLKEISHKICKDAIDAGLFVGVYGVNSRKDLDKILKYSVKAIVSNYPKELVNSLKELGVQ